MEKLRYFYIPITFEYWEILILLAAAYYGGITFFAKNKIKIK
jgi:hypothetical protein